MRDYYSFNLSINRHQQVVSMIKIKYHLNMKSRGDRNDTRETSGYWSSSSEDLNASARRNSSRDQRPTHIAFGTKVSLLSVNH